MSVAQPMLQQKTQQNETFHGPIGFVFASLRKSLGGIGILFKHPKMLLPMVVMSLLWVALSYLKLLMPDSGTVFFLSTLTFAQGGMYAGLMGAVGGVMGKMFFSWFITSALAPLLVGKEMAGANKSTKSKMPPLKGLGGLFQVLGGLGGALVLYQFLSGNASVENAMIGVTSFITCFRGVKRPDGFIQGFLRSFSRGRMKQESASRITLGLGLGFLGGIALTFMGLGTGCYFYGAILLVISLVFGFLTRNRRAAAAVGALLMIISLVPLPIYAVNDWQHPAEAYGIDPSTPLGMMELIRAMEATPPVSMELTLLATGFRNFEESLPLEEQKVLVEQGESGTFFVASGIFSEGRFDTSVNLYYDTDGWYADANTHYEVNNSWTGGQTETGSEITFEKCYFEAGVVGAASYLYQDYTQPGELYLSINVPFSYGDVISVSKASSATQILARVDRVSLTGAPAEQGSGRNGQWKLVERKSYMVAGGDSHGTSVTIPFDGEWYKPSRNVEGTYYQATVSEQGFYYIRHIISSEGPIIDEHEVTFQVPPDRLTAGELLTLRVSETSYFENPLAGTSGYRTDRLSGANFLPGTRPSAFNTFLADGSGRVLHLGPGLNETWFDEKGEELEAVVPRGQTTGEIMSLEILIASRQPYDPSDAYHWEVPVVAFVYQWESTGIPAEDEEEDPDGNIFGIVDLEDDWGSDWGSDDWEHANPTETGAINAASAIFGVVGAGAAMAGMAGGFGGPGGFKVPGGDYDPSDGTLVVTSPNGSQEIYRRDPVSGEFVSAYGSVLNVDDMARAQSEQRTNIANTRAELERMQNRSDGDSDYWRKVQRVEHMRAKLEKEGLEKGDALSTHMAGRMAQMKKDINSGKGFDEKTYGAVRNAYGRKTRGEIGHAGQLPGDYTDWQHAKDTVAMSSEEIARGESGKAVALRILTGMLTGGKSEMGFEAARSVYTTKDYVEAGGDSWREAVSKAALQTVTEEGIGRVAGAGIGLVGKVGGKATQLASKTRLGKAVVDKVSKAAGKTADFFGQNVSDVAKKALGMGAKQADDAARAMKAANAARAANAIKAASKQMDDAVKVAGNQADDVAKAASKASQEAAQQAGQKADDVVKAAAKQADDAAQKPANAYQKAREKWQAQARKAEREAQAEIEKYRKANQNKPSKAAERDALYREGQKLGQQKVDSLRTAQERLNRSPGSREAQDAYDEALRAVQQDKYAMNAMDQYRGPDASELRGKFNMRNEQYNQAALQNTRERLAIEREADLGNVSFVEATNAPGPGGRPRPAAAHRTASQVDPSQQSVPDYRGSATPDDMTVNSARVKGTPKDKDVTGRIVDPKTGEIIDIPKEDVERIYQQELYKAHHKGQLPRTKVNGRDVLDEDSIKKFAKDMDHTVTDRTGADAFGRGDRDLQNIMNKESTDIKKFEDITSVTGTMEYKSHEWVDRAQSMREQAAEMAREGADAEMTREMLRQAEALQGEGVRQMVKQFDNMVADQMTAVAATGRNVEISEKLLKSVRVLDQVGKENGITMAQAEAILKGMNTTVEDVVQQSSSLMESVAKLG